MGTGMRHATRVAMVIGAVAFCWFAVVAIHQQQDEVVVAAQQSNTIVSGTWALEYVSEDERAVVLRYRYGGCYRFSHTEVDEDAHAVTITVYLRRPAAPVTCPTPSAVGEASVFLDSPLASRELNHGPIDEGYPTAEPPTTSGQRLSGANRIETAVVISRYHFPEGADEVYLTRHDQFADAVAAGSLKLGPTLLVPVCGPLPPDVAEEIRRLAPKRAMALGGPAAVCPAILDEANRLLR